MLIERQLSDKRAKKATRRRTVRLTHLRVRWAYQAAQRIQASFEERQAELDRIKALEERNRIAIHRPARISIGEKLRGWLGRLRG